MEVFAVEASASLRRPVGVEAIHLSDAAAVGEMMDQAEAVGVTFGFQLVEHGEGNMRLLRKLDAALGLVVLEHVEEDGTLPVFLCLAAAGRAVMHDVRHVIAFGVPLKGAALELRVEGVDQPKGAVDMKAGGVAPIAEAREEVLLLEAANSLVRHPENDVADCLVLHPISRRAVAPVQPATNSKSGAPCPGAQVAAVWMSRNKSAGEVTRARPRRGLNNLFAL